MTTEHWMLIAVLVGAFGAAIGGAKDWSEVLKPGFIGPLLVMLGAGMRSLFVEKPK
jgi:hypothetical protein